MQDLPIMVFWLYFTGNIITFFAVAFMLVLIFKRVNRRSRISSYLWVMLGIAVTVPVRVIFNFHLLFSEDINLGLAISSMLNGAVYALFSVLLWWARQKRRISYRR